jgi:hypothetical protein
MQLSNDYLANADKCEERAREMPPALRRDFQRMARHWRKLAKDRLAPKPTISGRPESPQNDSTDAPHFTRKIGDSQPE